MNAKHTHYLLSYGGTSEIDVPAVQLSLKSRGRFVLAGEEGMSEREQLAALLPLSNARDMSNLAVVLSSLLPIVVDSREWGYVIWCA